MNQAVRLFMVDSRCRQRHPQSQPAVRHIWTQIRHEAPTIEDFSPSLAIGLGTLWTAPGDAMRVLS